MNKIIKHICLISVFLFMVGCSSIYKTDALVDRRYIENRLIDHWWR